MHKQKANFVRRQRVKTILLLSITAWVATIALLVILAVIHGQSSRSIGRLDGASSADEIEYYVRRINQQERDADPPPFDIAIRGWRSMVRYTTSDSGLIEEMIITDDASRRIRESVTHLKLLELPPCSYWPPGSSFVEIGIRVNGQLLKYSWNENDSYQQEYLTDDFRSAWVEAKNLWRTIDGSEWRVRGVDFGDAIIKDLKRPN